MTTRSALRSLGQGALAVGFVLMLAFGPISFGAEVASSDMDRRRELVAEGEDSGLFSPLDAARNLSDYAEGKLYAIERFGLVNGLRAEVTSSHVILRHPKVTRLWRRDPHPDADMAAILKAKFRNLQRRVYRQMMRGHGGLLAKAALQGDPGSCADTLSALPGEPLGWGALTLCQAREDVKAATQALNIWDWDTLTTGGADTPQGSIGAILDSVRDHPNDYNFVRCRVSGKQGNPGGATTSWSLKNVNNFYLAGQTCPGEGVVMEGGISFPEVDGGITHDVIISSIQFDYEYQGMPVEAKDVNRLVVANVSVAHGGEQGGSGTFVTTADTSDATSGGEGAATNSEALNITLYRSFTRNSWCFDSDADGECGDTDPDHGDQGQRHTALGGRNPASAPPTRGVTFFENMAHGWGHRAPNMTANEFQMVRSIWYGMDIRWSTNEQEFTADWVGNWYQGSPATRSRALNYILHIGGACSFLSDGTDQLCEPRIYFQDNRFWLANYDSTVPSDSLTEESSKRIVECRNANDTASNHDPPFLCQNEGDPIPDSAQSMFTDTTNAEPPLPSNLVPGYFSMPDTMRDRIRDEAGNDRRVDGNGQWQVDRVFPEDSTERQAMADSAVNTRHARIGHTADVPDGGTNYSDSDADVIGDGYENNEVGDNTSLPADSVGDSGYLAIELFAYPLDDGSARTLSWTEGGSAQTATTSVGGSNLWIYQLGFTALSYRDAANDVTVEDTVPDTTAVAPPSPFFVRRTAGNRNRTFVCLADSLPSGFSDSLMTATVLQDSLEAWRSAGTLADTFATKDTSAFFDACDDAGVVLLPLMDREWAMVERWARREPG